MQREVLRLRVYLSVLVIVVLSAAAGFMAVERLSLVDALYFSIATVTTVGYGDIVPRTTPGKLLTVALIIAGVGTFLGVVANATELLLNRREREFRLEKTKMVIGVFFSEAGTTLLAMFAGYDPNIEDIRRDLVITGEWTGSDFTRVCRRLREYEFHVDFKKVDPVALRNFLQSKTELLLQIYENPNLLEHEVFSDLLRAVLHLKEELISRKDFSGLPPSDCSHLAGDIKRVYRLLLDEWVDYMRYLKEDFPYLFSLAIRKNPFDPGASPVVKE